MSRSSPPATVQVTLRLVAAAERAALAEAMRPYLAELAVVEGTVPPEGYGYLPHYWTEAGRAPYWIEAAGERAGFALANRHVYLLRSAWSVAEFYVTPPWRRTGVGSAAACALLARHAGPWEVPVLVGHAVARRFWARALERCAPGRVTHVEEGRAAGWPGSLFVVEPAAPRSDSDASRTGR